MTQFSGTRIADYQAAVTGNAQLGPAISWLQANTAASRLSTVELYETLQAMAAASSLWTAMPKFNAVTVP
jgi:hypothetical protein